MINFQSSNYEADEDMGTIPLNACFSIMNTNQIGGGFTPTFSVVSIDETATGNSLC